MAAETGYVNVDLVQLSGVAVVCNAEALPFRSNLFQRVECDAVLEHTINPQQVIAEIYRCLKPGAFVHIVVPFCHPFHEYPRDYYRFTPDGLRELVQPPLKIVSLGWRTGPTATLLAFSLEYVKLWFSSFLMKRLVYGLCGWLLFPLRYLDRFLLRKRDATRMGNHCYVWARKETHQKEGIVNDLVYLCTLTRRHSNPRSDGDQIEKRLAPAVQSPANRPAKACPV